MMRIDGKTVLKNFGKALIAILCAAAMLFVWVIVSLMLCMDNVNGQTYALILLLGVILIELAVIGALWGFIKKKAFFIPVCVCAGICIIACGAVYGYQRYVDSIPTVGERESLLASYSPYAENTKAVELDDKSTLLMTDNLPVMDGATALYPVYAAFAKAVYPKEAIDNTAAGTPSKFDSGCLKCTSTTQAYKNIVTGDADIIFAAMPSEEQKRFAEESGVTLSYTPIGREAFVFFVNRKNPIENITAEQIQDIYSGKITKWDELGIKGFGSIKAFQRDEGSGSQTTLEKLMAGKSLMTPPKEDVIEGMGGIIKQTADYKNFKNAIGFSFRFYATEMVKDNKIKLLGIDGVYPDRQTIQDGTYPLASYFYAVTRSDADKSVLDLLDWITGEQGQKIVELTGYTPK